MTAEKQAEEKRVWYLLRTHHSEERLLKQETPSEEAQEFYTTKFEIELLISFLNFRSETPPLVSFGYSDGLVIQFYLVRFRNWEELTRKLKDYGPQHVYYDRNIYPDLGEYKKYRQRTCPTGPPFPLPIAAPLAHELAFDLDPENYDCQNCGPAATRTLEIFCQSCLQKTLEDTIKLCALLEEKRLSKIIPVVTGRGFHVHIQDETVLAWSNKQRKKLIQQVQKEGIIIDSHVTTGEMFLIRMPYSLHGKAGKPVKPLSLSELKSIGA